MERYYEVLSGMNGRYIVDNVAYKYIGRVRLSHVREIVDSDRTVRWLIKDLFSDDNQDKKFNIEVVPIRRDYNADTVIFVTCQNNSNHLKLIRWLDNKHFHGKALGCKPYGFVNHEVNNNLNERFGLLSMATKRFNELYYPGSINEKLAQNQVPNNRAVVVVENKKRSLTATISNEQLAPVLKKSAITSTSFVSSSNDKESCSSTITTNVSEKKEHLKLFLMNLMELLGSAEDESGTVISKTN